jgi:hypothetical protein
MQAPGAIRETPGGGGHLSAPAPDGALAAAWRVKAVIVLVNSDWPHREAPEALA